MATMNKVVVVLGLVAGCAGGDAAQGTNEAALTGSGADAGIDSGSGSGSGSSSTGPGPVWHSSMNGGGASVWTWDGQTSLWLNAYENGTGANRTVSLNYNFQGPDPASQQCYTYSDPWWGSWTYCYYTQYISEWGWGTVPSSDFSIGANASSARLHTTTGGDFYVEKCTYSYWPWGWGNCQYGVSESFDLAWNQDGFSSYSQDGTTRMQFGNYVQQNAGRYVSRSASANGTVAGHTLANAPGSIQDTQGMTVGRDIFRARP